MSRIKVLCKLNLEGEMNEITRLRLFGCLAGWKNSRLALNQIWTESDQQAYNQIKEQLQQKTVTMTEIENAVGDTSDEYTEGVVELFESKGFEVLK